MVRSWFDCNFCSIDKYCFMDLIALRNRKDNSINNSTEELTAGVKKLEINKMPEGYHIRIQVVLSRSFKVRIIIATLLLRLVGRVLGYSVGCNVTTN